MRVLTIKQNELIEKLMSRLLIVGQRLEETHEWFKNRRLKYSAHQCSLSLFLLSLTSRVAALSAVK